MVNLATWDVRFPPLRYLTAKTALSPIFFSSFKSWVLTNIQRALHEKRQKNIYTKLMFGIISLWWNIQPAVTNFLKFEDANRKDCIISMLHASKQQHSQECYAQSSFEEQPMARRRSSVEQALLSARLSHLDMQSVTAFCADWLARKLPYSSCTQRAVAKTLDIRSVTLRCGTLVRLRLPSTASSELIYFTVFEGWLPITHLLKLRSCKQKLRIKQQQLFYCRKCMHNFQTGFEQHK